MKNKRFRVWTGSEMEYNIVVGVENSYFINTTAECVTRYDKKTPTMQTTGYKDIYGNEIYDGDIIKMPIHMENNVSIGEEICEICQQEDGSFCVGGKYYTESLSRLLGFCDVIIVGNIYKNPSLLFNK